jgi:hypothetical protein
MNDIAIALIGFGGTVSCLGLAYWVFQRGRAATPSEPTAEPVTELLSREEIFARVGAARASAPGTEMIPQAEILAAASRRAAASSKDPSPTELL